MLYEVITNQAIQGHSFPNPDSVAAFLRFSFRLPAVLGGGTITPFSGFELSRLPYLFALVITSYSIHYTKLYDADRSELTA